MSHHYSNPGAQRRRYQAVMKSWRRLRRDETETIIRQRSRRRHLLEELRALDLEQYDYR